MAEQRLTIRISSAVADGIAGVKAVRREVKGLDRDLDGVDSTNYRRQVRRMDDDNRRATRGLTGLIKKFVSLNTVMKGMKFMLLYTGLRLIIPLASGLSAWLFQVAGSLGSMTGTLAAYPAAAAGFISVLGAMKFATIGVGDAIGTLMKDSATVEEVQAALEKLSPAGREFARALRMIKRETDPARMEAQHRLFTGINEGLGALARSGYISRVVAHFVEMADAIGDVAAGFGRMMGSDGVMASLNKILPANERNTRRFGRILTTLAEIVIHVTRAAMPMFEKMLERADIRMSSLLETVKGAIADGSLEAYFLRSWAAAQRFGRFLGTIWRGLKEVLTIGNQMSEGFIKPFEQAGRNFERWTKSAEGQKKINRWFERGAKIMDAVWRLFGAVGRALGTLGEQGQASMTLITFLDALSKKGGVIDALAGTLASVDSASLSTFVTSLADAAVAFFTLFNTLEPAVAVMGAVLDFFKELFIIMQGLPGPVKDLVSGIGGLVLAYKGLGMISSKFGISAILGFEQANAGISGFVRGYRGSLKVAADGTVEHIGLMGRLGRSMQQAGGFKNWITMLGKGSVELVKFTAFAIKYHAVLTALWIKQKAIAVATRIWAGVQWLLNSALWANPIGIVVAAIAALVGIIIYAYRNSETFRNIIQSVWEWIQKAAAVVWDLFLRFTPLGRALTFIRDNFDSLRRGAQLVWRVLVETSPIRQIINLFRMLRDMVMSVVNAFSNARRAWDEFSSGQRGGFAGRVVSWFNPFGDTSPQRPDRMQRAGSGRGLASTMAVHDAVERMTPGKRTITNATKGRWRGSDHHRGRALDLRGPFMGAYQQNLKRMGGWSETHGQGSQQHVHAVYPVASGPLLGGGGGGASGDTMRPRSGGGVEAVSGDIVIQGPLIGEINAHTEMDIERAVFRGLERAVKERMERR